MNYHWPFSGPMLCHTSAITIAAISVAVTAGSAVAANKQAKSTNKRLAAQNADQLMLDMAARGAPIYGANLPDEVQGSQAAVLPYYGGDTETKLFGDARSIYDAIRARAGTPAEQVAMYDDMLRKFEPANESNRQMVYDMASGKMVEQEIGESQPVFQARRGVAEAKRNAGLEALRETLNEIDSIQAGKGYSGDSTGKRMLRFNARRSIGTSSANDFAEVDLANALETRGLLTNDRSRRLTNIDLPDRLARAEIAREELPGDAASEAYQRSLGNFKMFNIGTHDFTPPAPYVDKPDILGSVASSVGGTANTLLADYLLKQQAKGKSPGVSTGDWAGEAGPAQSF